MIEAADPILERLRTTPWEVLDTDATGVSKFPYVLVVPPAGARSLEQALAGARGPLEGSLLVKAVGTSARAARLTLGRTREVLNPGGRAWTFRTATHEVTLTFGGAVQEGVVDRDAPTTTTNTHPVVYADEYDLTAVPL